MISALADVDFYRGAPPAGCTKGLPAALRTDKGEGDIAPEIRGTDFYPYKPYHLASAPPRPMLAKVTNDMQRLVSSGDYDGVIWTQGSPQVEEVGLLVQPADRHDAADLRQRRAAPAGPDQRMTGRRTSSNSVNFIASRRLGRRQRPQPLRLRRDPGAADLRRARGGQGRCAAGRLCRDRRAWRHSRQCQPHRPHRADLPAGLQAHLSVRPEAVLAAQRSESGQEDSTRLRAARDRRSRIPTASCLPRRSRMSRSRRTAAIRAWSSATIRPSRPT